MEAGVEADGASECSAVALYQLFLLAHYLLNRCVVNRLYPAREEWGFDMFQALNATGTPLTAMETFLPQVMQAERAGGEEWSETPSAEAFAEIDRLFDKTSSNQSKNRRTNELLGAFRLCYDGEKLPNRFSAQRRWMTQCYEKTAENIQQKRVYVRRLAGVAQFYRDAWYMDETTKPTVIRGLEDDQEGELASFLVQYLKDASSRLSAPILARYYIQAMTNPSLVGEFVEAVKACAAYFTLVRSTRSTTRGLDDTYRRFYKGSGSLTSPLEVEANSWTKRPEVLAAAELKQYFRNVLRNRNVGDRDGWMTASETVLNYRELQKVVRFVLFMAGHERVPSESEPGLTDPGRPNVCRMLSLDRWRSADLKSVEHVAPQSPPQGHDWDSTIYSEDLVHDVGNLLLLPSDINRFAANKNWSVKYWHYCHLGQRNEVRLLELKKEARRRGVQLKRKLLRCSRERSITASLRR